MNHDQLAGSELHSNKIYSETGTELSPTSLIALDTRWSLKSHALVGPAGTVNNDYTAVNGNSEQAINAAILDCYTAGGGVVELRRGTFLTAAQIVLYPRVIVIGQGMGVTTIMGSPSDYLLIGTIKTGTSKTVYQKTGAKYLTIVSQKGDCLIISNTTGIVLSELESYFSGTSTIKESLVVQHCQAIAMEKNYLHDLTGDGIQVNGSDYFIVSQNTIVGGANSDDLIDIDKDFLDTKTIMSNHGSVVGNNIADGRKGNGVRIGASNHIAVTGNTVDSISTDGGAGIYINAYSDVQGANGCSNITVGINTIKNCLTNGIAVVASGSNLVDDCVLLGNTLQDCGQAGGTNIRAGIQLASPGVSCIANNLDNCGRSGADGGSIVVFKKSGQHVTNNKIRNAAGIGFNLWNGDGLQSYTDIQFTHNPFENVPTPISASALSSGLIRDNLGANDVTPLVIAADGLVVGATQLVAKNGNVGIGTANPVAKFEVHDNQISGNEIGSISVRGAADPTKRLNFGYDESGDYAWIQAVKNGQAKRKIYFDTLGLGLGTNAPSGMLDVNDNRVRVRIAKTPSSATDTGNAGEVCWDASYVYICTATNTWKRVAISTW